MMLNMGLGSSVFASGYGPAATPEAAVASPQGPTTIGQKAFGIVTGGSSSGIPHVALLSGGFLALAGLAFIYWSLPR
jgi:hypothetical protein